MNPAAIRISRKQNSARTYDCITLVVGDMHFHKDIMSDRDIRFARAMADFHGAEFICSEELAARVDAALVNYRGVSASSEEPAPNAARYLWLRENWVEFHPQPAPEPFANSARLRRNALDAAIDAARSAAQPLPSKDGHLGER